MTANFSGKGDWPRPCSVTREELALRHEYMSGEMTLTEFNKKFKKLKEQGLIKRNGRVIE
jgi:hypothetical protein